MNQLHPGARWIFRLRAYYPLFLFGIFIIILSLPILRTIAEGYLTISIVITALFYILFVIVVAEIYARMSYNRYLYEITHDEIKIERGIIWKKYTSIPYERIQNVDIRRGIIARMFGFSTVEIETAGQSGSSRYGRSNKRYESEGHLPAIDALGAEKIREFVMKKIKHIHNSTGL